MIDYTLSDKLKVQYQTANPFPYIVIDNFLPEFILKKTKEEILKHDTWFSDNIEWTKPYQQKKFYYPGHDTKMDELSMKLPITNLVMDYLNSNEFIVFLEKITGFKKLYRDPILMGGGIHKIKRGGKLSIHKDYNEHPKTKKQRRINVLIYLNENWESSWGGNLELWSNDTWKKSVEMSGGIFGPNAREMKTPAQPLVSRLPNLHIVFAAYCRKDHAVEWFLTQATNPTHPVTSRGHHQKIWWCT